jgi:hypothetical protein
MLAKMAPVGAGAPPVKLEVDEAASDARVAAGLDVDAGVDVDADVDAAESRESADDLAELTAPDRDASAEDNVSLAAASALLMKLLTSEGRLEYHEGVLPALKSLWSEDITCGSLRAVRRVDGIAVARTEKIETSVVGRSKLRVARSDVRDALRRRQTTEYWKDRDASLQSTILGYGSSRHSGNEERLEMHVGSGD